jgi:hypothetical protein
MEILLSSARNKVMQLLRTLTKQKLQNGLFQNQARAIYLYKLSVSTVFATVIVIEKTEANYDFAFKASTSIDVTVKNIYSPGH